jgi:transposase InsO family protein
VALVRWGLLRHLSIEQVAARLELCVQTLRGWLKRWAEDRFALVERGRPLSRGDRELRNSLVALFGLMGPHVGLPTIRNLMPDVPRNELAEMMRRYRHAYRRWNSRVIHALRWQRPGAVWAMDHSQPPAPIDGVYSRLFVVRDLASGAQLLALPCKSEDQQTVLDALKALCCWHGRPLVIKSDNGGALRGERVTEWLDCQKVRQLFSPRGTPRYNGACEAGIGSLKTRAHFESARCNRPGEWTCDDIEAARCQANDTARPGGWKQPTPSDLWARRGGGLLEAEREKFNELCERYEAEVRKEQGWIPGLALGHYDQSAIDRVAISRALMDCGYLTVRRRRITPPITRPKLTKIS